MQFGKHLNQYAQGPVCKGRGALTDALTREVFDKLSAVYYPNVEAHVSSAKELKQLQIRQNGYDLVRLPRDLLVLAVPHLPGLAQILDAAESLELPSLASNRVTNTPPRQLRVVMADLLRQHNVERAVTKYFWHLDEAEKDGMIWYTFVLFLGKETRQRLLDTTSKATIGVRIAGFNLVNYDQTGSFVVFPSHCYHRSESNEPVTKQNPDEVLGEYKLVLFLGPIDSGIQIDWEKLVTGQDPS